MIKVKFTQKQNIKAQDFSKKEIPAFASYEPNLEEIKNFAKPFLKYKNIVICGRGGSTTSFRAYFEALKKFNSTKNVFIVDTVDPDYLSYVKKSCPNKETIVLVISKSGTTVDVLENYLFFAKYNCIFVVTPGDNTLANIAKIKNIPVLAHPEIGGRYSGLTATALLPAELMGISVGDLWSGAKKAYKDFAPENKENLAFLVASQVFENYLKGRDQIYFPIYSKALFGFSELIMQLIHESWAKENKGGTVVVVDAPESQHHSNQRFFGGRKNMQGLFLKLENFESKTNISVEKEIEKVTLREKSISFLDNQNLNNSMEAEFVGNFVDAQKRNVPLAVLELEKITAESIGYLTGFLHYFTVYLCWLEGVNPFDQPEVESSKEISFLERTRN